jgi:uncharacterized membrane protein YjdF
MSDINLQKRNEQLERLHRANKIFFWLIIVMAVFNITYLILKGDSTWDVIAFRGVQYVAMLLIMLLPNLLKKHLKIEVPWVLSIAVVIFCFSALILGDGLDLYGKLPWWDKLLHSESGILLSLIALWLIHIVMAENDKYIYLNRWFLAIFLVMFSLGLGACWEIMEFTYDSLMGTNTQQFMATTTGSIFTPEDIPLCGHEALKDSMSDLILDLLGALAVAIYGFINHDKLLKRYYTDAHIDGLL